MPVKVTPEGFLIQIEFAEAWKPHPFYEKDGLPAAYTPRRSGPDPPQADPDRRGTSGVARPPLAGNRVDVDDADHYDLVIDREAFSADQVVDQVLHALHAKTGGRWPLR
ncbi:MAG: hypothetical protein IID39_02370 [Planctomycetes bacterium]|nr:hypothetical protein [Planctomycetota bacterium]